MISGRVHYPLDPDIDNITVEDIAHALGNICRYGGMTLWHYPVAQHAVLITRWLRSQGHSPMVQFSALHHDDPEALSGFGDVVRPVKGEVSFIYELEEMIWQRIIVPKFGLTAELPAAVVQADYRICADERDLCMSPCDREWATHLIPLGVTILQWSQAEAKAQYLNEHHRLLGELAE